MRISEAFPSKYLKASDFERDKDYNLNIDRVVMEEMEDGEHKAVAYFQGAKKGLVLNKTNANTIAAMYGDETGDWATRPIVLGVIWTEFKGEPKQGIRVRPMTLQQMTGTSPAPQQPTEQPAPQTENPAADISDDVPF